MHGMEHVKVVIVVDVAVVVVNGNTSGIPAQAQIMYSFKILNF
jgi:hypothetical protein